MAFVLRHDSGADGTGREGDEHVVYDGMAGLDAESAGCLKMTEGIARVDEDRPGRHEDPPRSGKRGLHALHEAAVPQVEGTGVKFHQDDGAQMLDRVALEEDIVVAAGVEPVANPVVVSGNDVGFRIEGQQGHTPVGKIVVRIKGQWVEAALGPVGKPPLIAVPLTERPDLIPSLLPGGRTP